MSDIKVCIQNLGKYNEGTLDFTWVELPATDEELARAYDRIQICHDDVKYMDCFGCPYEEIMIADWESEIDLGFSEFADLQTLNERAEQIDELDEYEVFAVRARMESGEDFDHAYDHRADVCVYYGCDDMEDVARQMIDDTGLLRDVPNSIAMYFDYAAYGRDLDLEGTFIELDGAIVEVY